MNNDSEHSKPECINSEEFPAQISDENFNFREVRFKDRKVTGAQIAMEIGAHPVEEFVIMQWLKSFELETIRPTELIDLSVPTKIFVIRGSMTYRFVVDGLSFEWPLSRINGFTIKRLVGKNEEDVDLILERETVEDQIIKDDENIQLNESGVEHFRTCSPHEPLTIYVDGELYTPPRLEMTPNEIIVDAVHMDVASHYLVMVKKPENISFKNKGNELIHLRRGMSFLVMSLDSTEVSAPNQVFGVQAFIDGLKLLGYTPQQLLGKQNHIYFDYIVENGRFRGEKIRMGFIIPTDFPMNPPTGPHISPEIHPINTSGQHPLGAIHKQQALPFEAGAGGKWEYWSRPFTSWQTSKKTVSTYMSHIAKLWESQ